MKIKNCVTAMLVISILAFFVSTALAQNEEQKDYNNNTANGDENRTNGMTIRPGMELKKIGGLNLIVPEGTQIYRNGAQLIMEEADDYTARNLKEMKSRLDKVEKGQEELKNEFEKLRDAVSKAQEKK